MKTLEEIIRELPKEIRLPIYEAFQVFRNDILRKEIQEVREELKEIRGVIKELSEAQKKTEQRVEELARAQKKTEEEMASLSREVKKLVVEHRKTREQLGGLTHAFGYVLEDRAIKSFPKLLKKNYNIEVIGKLKREYLVIDGEYIEVNIYGKVKRDRKEYILIGEAKSKVSKKIIDNFVKKCDKISKESIRVIVSYIFPPDIKKYAESKNIILIPSYELEL